ncbi:spore coat protein [Desulfuribacillus stibiiarsenatis]|uniref:Glucose-1-phosphate thymidylyltransferase n=1 Tax=Desulfuribacillus stibiiarsenatis TaxID=1390249 RepID=A0A1E5L9A1_9FIRM|nr:sugar phosphate nucleotidyltransferase [Desulfuribacillus stibiiarsenatis]OEH86737.1 spore coat protein [Desulfuribacillus stibiiarsenatis]
MKGVILAGGLGTRLYPLTKITNKHLLPVGKEPMILNPVKQLISAGINNILVVTSKEHMGDVVRLLGSGRDYGCSFTFKVQEEAKGIANALLLAEDFVNKDSITVILGDNIATHSIKPYVDNFIRQESGAKVLLRKVSDPERYGVAALDEQNVIEIEEKPNKPKSDYAVIGIYMFDHKVFDIIKSIRPSSRGEYEITSVNNVYLEKKELTYDILGGEWTDAGTFESLQYANEILLKYDNTIIDS